TSTATRPQTSTATRPQTPIETKPPTLTETRPSASTGSGSLRTPPAAIVPKTLTFESELKKLQTIFQCRTEKSLNLRLNNVYEDMAKKFRLFFKTKLSPVTVTFFEEVGVDDGGLTREAFSKVFATANREVLCGMENRFTLIHDKIKLEAGDFFIFGQMLSMALLMGASGPHNLSKPFAEHLLSFKEPKSYDIKDVPVAEVQEKLVGIKNCQTKEELDDCFASFDERFEAGYNKMVLNMDEREHFCRLISRFFIVERNHAEISQLLKGVHPDLLSLMRRFPEEGIKELVYTAKHIKASDITSNWIYDFSAPTSLKRKDENN
uniref:HECT domain-containing protein n=1 Tax=Clytia hemisphaerica TaxID=252671 RepID=A0A7M5XN72_9CNID